MGREQVVAAAGWNHTDHGAAACPIIEICPHLLPPMGEVATHWCSVVVPLWVKRQWSRSRTNSIDSRKDRPRFGMFKHVLP